MANYAHVDDDGTVIEVIVAPSITWVTQHLDGTWVKATNNLGSDQYPGPGWTWNGDVFAPPLELPVDG